MTGEPGLASRPGTGNPSSAEDLPAADRSDSGPSSLVVGPSSFVELRYVGEAGGLEEKLAARAGIPFTAVTTGQVRGQGLWAAGRNLVRILNGARQCASLIRTQQPDVIFITGGYVTAPLAWAAWRTRLPGTGRRVPVLVYLPDLEPGLAIRWAGRLARRVAVSFPEVARYFPGKAVVTGYPVRPELVRANRAAARQALGLEEEASLPVVLIFGGSRGARSINQATVQALPDLLPRCHVLHVSGQLDWPWVETAAKDLPEGLRRRYHPYAYLHEEMVQALAAADLAVARAGAATLGEFPALGLPSVLVPYPYAGRHQDANAAFLAGRGAAVIVEDQAVAQRLGPVVLELLDEPGRLRAMAESARALARPDAAWNIARELVRLGEL